MKKFLWRLVAIAIVLISYVTYSHPDWIVDPPSFLATAYAQGECAGYPDGKCEFNPSGTLQKDPTNDLPDPNRPYFDQWGNKFNYDGTLIQAAPCSTDPISKQPNPYSCAQTQPVVDNSQSETDSAFTGK